ncbi:hypothetical protein JOB18_010626 [Solea senegalensis]|uniref:Uncharacterized protein n=1 Tax=Solea senegalensis TaxID=28829 RepID=A0AAV6SJ65_SOLSE|nr:hypothetical protein JOB18_010626 [Solea senegalensis]
MSSFPLIHQRQVGHTLDLVITDSLTVTELHSYDTGVSDHQAVIMKLPLPSPYTKPKRIITFRNINNIDSPSFSHHLQLLLPPTSSSVSNLVDFYNNSLSSILDSHAPLKKRTVSFSRSAPWYTKELRQMKRSGRVLERASVASGLTVHKLAYREHQRSYAKALSVSRSEHYSTIINNNPELREPEEENRREVQEKHTEREMRGKHLMLPLLDTEEETMVVNYGNSVGHQVSTGRRQSGEKEVRRQPMTAAQEVYGPLTSRLIPYSLRGHSQTPLEEIKMSGRRGGKTQCGISLKSHKHR